MRRPFPTTALWVTLLALSFFAIALLLLGPNFAIPLFIPTALVITVVWLLWMGRGLAPEVLCTLGQMRDRQEGYVLGRFAKDDLGQVFGLSHYEVYNMPLTPAFIKVRKQKNQIKAYLRSAADLATPEEMQALAQEHQAEAVQVEAVFKAR